MAKVTVSYGKCSVSVLGMDMNCPLCGVLVESGNTHTCEATKPKVIEASKKAKKRLGKPGDN